jgi:predicted nucleotide-binding protein
MAKDLVTLRKRDGTEIPGVQSMVQRDIIFIVDPNVPVEEGDIIFRKLRSGTDEYFEVLDRGYQSGMEGIDPHYQAKVRRVQPRQEFAPAQSMDPRRVFVVYGRNERALRAMTSFLRAINLRPIEWTEAVAMTGDAAPFIGQVVEAGFAAAQAAVVLLTGDDLAQLQPTLHTSDDPDFETRPTPQARPNVLFEAGYAFARNPKRTVLVEFGRLRPFSDVQGRHVLRIDNTTQKRQELADRLRTAGCEVSTQGTEWHTEGDFEGV